MYYIKEILNDDILFEKEQKNYLYIQNSLIFKKNDFNYRIFDNLNSSVLLSDYEDNNKIIYMTPNFKKIILLSNESNDITINNLIPNAIVKFHNNLVNNSIFYWNVDQIFIKQKNIMIKTKNNTLLNTKLFVKEFPNLSYGLIFIIHIEKILSNEFKIILDKDLKINGYSDESNLLKRDTYDNYGLVQNCIGIPICSIIPEIILYLTNNYNDKDKENNDDKEREIILKNKIIIQRGNLYEYKISSLNKKIIDKSFDVLNHIKKGDSKKFDIISKMKEKQKEEIKDYTKTISDTSLIFTGEKSLSKKYTELLAEIENNAFKKVKIEYEIIERSFLNNKYKYYLLTIRKDIYNYDYEVEENNANNNEKITSSKNVLLNTTIENNFNFKKNMEKQIKLNNDINKNTNLNNKKEEENNPQQDIGNINEKDKQNENGNNSKILKIKEEAINKIKEKIIQNNLKTNYDSLMLFISILVSIILYIFLIFDYFDRKKNLNKISDYLDQNLYYNQTRIYVSHLYIIFINFVFIKTNFLNEFSYNNISCIDIYKDFFKSSIDHIFELTKINSNFDIDYYEILSNYSEINIKNPYEDNNRIINMTNFQLIKLIVSNSLKFSYNIDNFLGKNENEKYFRALCDNIDKHSIYYIFYDFNGFDNNVLRLKLSKKFSNIPYTLIFICIIIFIFLGLFSYIIYILNYYEKFFLTKIVNLTTKEFEDYLKHFEELKYKLKNSDEEDTQKTDISGEADINKNPKLIPQYTNDQNNILEDENENEQRNQLKKEENKIIDKDNNKNMENKNNSDNNIQNNISKKEEENGKRINKASNLKKKKNSKREKQKKIKLIEQKRLKISKMLNLILVNNFVNLLKIIISILVGITYYIFQFIYSTKKINSFTDFNIILESIEYVFTESYITYLNFKLEIFKYVDFYNNNMEEIKNSSLKNYTLNMLTNENYIPPDFNNYIMEILKDFKDYDGNNTDAIIYKLYNSDACKIIYSSDNSNNYEQCKIFWSGVFSKGLEQGIIEMGNQFSILINLFSYVNSGQEYIEDLINDNQMKSFDIFMMTLLYNSFEKSHYYFNILRIQYVEENKNTFKTIFYIYLIIYLVITLIFISFVFSVILLFKSFLNFIAIIPAKILCEDRDINQEIINLSKKII